METTAGAGAPLDAAAPTLSAGQRRELRAQAHALRPVVQIGSDGLSTGVVSETDRALSAHGLIKVRILDEAREHRASMLEALCAATGAAAVQHIGKTLVLWRPKPQSEKPVASKRSAAAAPRVPGSRRSAADTPKRRGGSLDTRSRDRQASGRRRKTPRGGSSQGR